MIMHHELRPGPPGPEEREYRPQIDGLRFSAFLGIFLLHSNSGRWPAGVLGVPLFFTLSGFLITRILVRHAGQTPARELSTFYARRALRIFPLYYAVLLVLLASGQLERPWACLAHVYNYCVYANRAFVGRSGHFWSLSVEEQFYLIFPLLLLATPARHRARMLGGLFAACAGSRILLEWLLPNPYTFALTNAAGEYLIAGAVAGHHDALHPGIASSRPRLVTGLGLSALAAGWASGWRFGLPGLAPVVPELTALAFALSIGEVWRDRGPIARFLGVRPLAYLGKISYGCYVLHVYAMQYVYDGPGGPWTFGVLPAPMLPSWGRAPVALAITLAAAMASWHLFEAPILALKSRFSYGGGTTRGRRAMPAIPTGQPSPAWSFIPGRTSTLPDLSQRVTALLGRLDVAGQLNGVRRPPDRRIPQGCRLGESAPRMTRDGQVEASS
jgi:peptidoglycan/LPS O-acetylase OafA/YrhL